MKFTFDDNERRAAIQLIDLAIKSGGLQTAEAGLRIVQILNTPDPEPEVKEKKPN